MALGTLALIFGWLSTASDWPWDVVTGFLAMGTFAILVVASGVQLRGFHRRRKSQAARAALLADPLIVEHFIPQSTYKLRAFAGAPDEEGFPEELVIGIGKYRILQRVMAKTELIVGSVVLHLDGPPENSPQVGERDNPYIIERLPEGQVRDWHGVVLPDMTGVWPRQYDEGVYVMIGNSIETTTEWEGHIRLAFSIHGAKRVSYRLRFRVSAHEDMIPFLRGWSDDATKQER